MATKPPSRKGATPKAAALAAAPDLAGLKRKLPSEKKAPAADSPEAALNPRQERFCEEFLTDLNGTNAYLRAGYEANRDAARSAAARLLADVRVQNRIAELKARRRERLGITQDRWLEGIAAVCYLDVAKLFDAKGDMLPVHKLPVDVRMALAGVEIDGKAVKVKFDRTRNMEMLGKHLGALKERVVHETDPEDPVVKMLEEIYGQAGNRWQPKARGATKKPTSGRAA